jgi:hypothetical protein
MAVSRRSSPGGAQFLDQGIDAMSGRTKLRLASTENSRCGE